MNKQNYMEKIYTPNAPEPIGPYSQAIKIDSRIYTSGQVAIDPKSNTFIGGDIESQTRLALENIKAILEAGGSNVSKVFKTTVFLKDMNEFSAMNEVYSEFFGETKPARSTVEVARLPKDAKVEIEVIAYF